MTGCLGKEADNASVGCFMKRITRLRNNESGFSLVFVGCGMLAFVAVSMLAIDVGMLMTSRNQAQNAADAGALAGATALVYDNWNDRSASGPAVTNAIAAAHANQVMGGTVSVKPEDVQFLNDPVNGQPDRVQVTVHRTVSTLIAKYFGIATADINAIATAEASPANAMTCVKPFTIPDKWLENGTTPSLPTDNFDRYDKKGNLLSPADKYEPAYLDPQGTQKNPNYAGYNMETNRGVKLVLRAGQGNDIQPSFYFSLAMTADTGGDDYRWNIANCNHSIYHWSDPLVQEPGDKEGPTIQGIQELIDRDPGASWNESTNTVQNSKYGDRQSPRVFPIPLYDPDYYDYGKETGRVASLKVANWIGFFVEYIGNGSEIHGRIIPIGGIRDKTFSGGIDAFPKTIRLVQ
jgi:Flp pilus assembly protein TadG